MGEHNKFTYLDSCVIGVFRNQSGQIIIVSNDMRIVAICNVESH